MKGMAREPDAGTAGDTEKAVLAVSLAGVAGFVDVVGYLSLFGIFTAHMSGNSAELSAKLGHGALSPALTRGLAVLFFVLAVAAGAAVIEGLARAGVRSPTSVTLTVEILLLVALVASGKWWLQAGLRVGTAPFFVLMALAVGAMGLQTASLRRVGGRTVRTTYVTGMLTALAESAVGYVFLRRDLRRSPGGPRPDRKELRAAGHRALLLAGIWCAYIGGGVAGAVLERRWRLDALLIPAAVLVVVVAVDLLRPVRPVAAGGFGHRRRGESPPPVRP